MVHAPRSAYVRQGCCRARLNMQSVVVAAGAVPAGHPPAATAPQARQVAQATPEVSVVAHLSPFSDVLGSPNAEVLEPSTPHLRSVTPSPRSLGLPSSPKCGASDSGPQVPLFRRRSSEDTSLGEDFGSARNGASFHDLCYRPSDLFAAPRRRFYRVGVIPCFGAY